MCQKKSKSEIRQNLIQLNEIGPNPASNDCQRRRSPRASIDCQEKVPQSQQCQEVTPIPAKIVCRATRLSKAPRSVDVSPGHTEGGHPRPAIHPNPEVIHPGVTWLDSNSFFGRSAAQEARRRNPDVIRDVRRPTGRLQQLPDALQRRQQWRPSPTRSSFTAFTPVCAQAGGHDPRLSGK